MTDPNTLSNALLSLKAAIDIAKALRGADMSLEKAELKFKIADLTDALLAARAAVMDAQEEIAQLEARIKQLEAAQDVRSRLVKRGNVYFVKGEDGNEEGPYCPRCFEVDKHLIPVAAVKAALQGLASYKCPNCGEFY